MSDFNAKLAAEAIDREVEGYENHWTHVDTFRHADGSATVIVIDQYGDAESPRDYDGNVATLIQVNSHCIDIDIADDRIAEAVDRWGRRGRHAGLVERYVAMFRPDIALYVDHWSAGDSYGWGYVTEAALAENFPDHLIGGDRAAYFAKHDMTVQSLFDAEVKLYSQWAEGEVYGAHHLTVGEPVIRYGDEGAYIDDYRVDEDDCRGFLGYDDLKDICENFTDSPIV